MSFHVGQKVVCINDSNGPLCQLGSGYSCGLRNGAIFEVVATWMTETIPMVEVGGIKGGWRAERFRPLIERKTDISSLVALLNPVNHKPMVDA